MKITISGWSTRRRRGADVPGLARAADYWPAVSSRGCRTVPCGITTPAMEERNMELMPEDAKAVLLLLARQLPYETGKAIDATTDRRSTLR